MVDIVDTATRRRMMAGIRNSNTGIEIAVRHALFAQGLRYRLHGRNLPGRPDIVFPKYRAVVFMHGCFWHGHTCPLFKLPGTRTEFWRDKIDTNRRRDARNNAALLDAGWRVLTIWECALRGPQQLGLDHVAVAARTWIESTAPSTELAGRAAR